MKFHLMWLCLVGVFGLEGWAGGGAPEKTNCDAEITWEVVAEVKLTGRLTGLLTNNEPVNEIRELESRLPGPGPIVARCLHGRARARYDNGHELMLDLRRLLVRDRGSYLRDFSDYFFQTIYQFS